jgi:hypothetical protein
MLLFCVNLILLGKNVLNLIVIKKFEKIKKIKHMKTFNIWLFPTILLQLLLYANSFLENVGIGGYPLILYQIIASTQVLALNSLMALGGYLWLEMIFRMSFNNMKKLFVSWCFRVCCTLNIIFFLFATITPILSNLQDVTWWPDFEFQANIIMIMVTFSTVANGIFFSVGSFYAYRFENKKLVCDLTLLAGIFSLIRIIQDFLQTIGTGIGTLKEESVAVNGWGYPIYVLIYLIVSNVIPTLIFLQRYSPSLEKNEYRDNNSQFLPMDDNMNILQEKSENVRLF